jgi:hypothetical protein
MEAEQTIAEIEYLERIFVAPDTRPLSTSDLLVRIESTMICWRVVRGFSFGSDMACVAEPRPQCFD